MNNYQALLNEMNAEIEQSSDYWAAGYTLDFIEELSNIMTAKSVTQSKLSRLTGCSRQRISKIMNGSENLTVHTMAKLALALGCYVNSPKLVEIKKEPTKEQSQSKSSAKSLHHRKNPERRRRPPHTIT